MPLILGIDPGSRQTGFGLIDHTGNTMTCIAEGHIAVKDDDLHQRLYQIYSELKQLIHRYRPTLAAIERVFVNKNVQSALKLGQARGAALVALAEFQLPVGEYSPREIKQAVVGYGAAEKPQIQAMVMRLLNLTEKPQADAADALAIAICHAHCYKFKMKLEQVR